MSIKINEPYDGYSKYSEYMIELKKMSDEEIIKEYERLSKFSMSDEELIKKSILVDFIVRFDKEYLLV
ncbi:hypothetical protein [Methanobrevibacter sp. UBA212]|uniref:hypothetical protein n=1 Tax=Methanobrevibacter sp. UBA212 TaxID=1915476 RepID=UPI0025CE031F|nr:hypothetical protein [Methanobrevibacter sp. UBA212]